MDKFISLNYTGKSMRKSGPLFPQLKYCTRCCMPETQERVLFDEMGVCQSCQSSEQKIHINWAEREKHLSKIIKKVKSKAGDNYDCVVPMGGGKDSMFQLHVLTKIYGMKPLAVTFGVNWWSETGWHNLQNTLEKLGVDNVLFTPNRALINKLAKKSVEEIGDVSWHDHAGTGSFPLQIAVKFKIPLLIWGESIAEASGRTTYKDSIDRFDRDYFIRESAKRRADQMVDENLTTRDLYPFTIPSEEEVKNAGMWGIHLGDYIFWDEERQAEFVRDTYGWKETSVENSYKRYKSTDDIMYGMHDFTCYLKRGYGRTSMQASMDVRNGLLTRDEAFDLIRKYDPERPEALDYYLKITGSSEEEFYRAMEKLRMPALKGTEMPVIKKTHKNEERILPFPEQLIEKFHHE